MFLVPLAIAFHTSLPHVKCLLVGFQNFLILLLETINVFKKGFSKKI